MSLLAIGATAVTGWFEAGKGEWCYDLCGDLTDDHSSGELINDLEAETGQKFPALRTKLQEVVDAWRTFQRAMPWNKGSTKATYEAKAQEYATALEAQIMATSPVPALGGDFLEQLKGMSPIVWIAMAALLIMAVTLVAFRRPRRR
jgi:hypothetical protein